MQGFIARNKAKRELFRRLERILCGTLDPEFKSHQYLYVYNKYVDHKGLVALLAMKRSAGVAPEMNLRNRDKTCKGVITLALKPRGYIKRRQKRGYNGPTKKDNR